MPEGDSIHRIALALAPRLIGATLERVTTQGLERDVAGQTVVSVTAHGKHLVIELADGTHLRAHLGMYGRQRSYTRAEGDRMLARMSPGKVSLAITTKDGVHLWIGAKTIEVSKRRAPMHGQAIAAIGPDILGDELDTAEVARRAAAYGNRTLADVLLDQRVASGIGNIYKCESLFLCGIDPRDTVSAVELAELERLYATAREIMLVNVRPKGMRATRERLSGDVPGDERYFVYSRSGKPCRRCKTTNIDCYQLGNPPRWTWSCATCQPRRGGPIGVSR
jgi:endonuclease-8